MSEEGFRHRHALKLWWRVFRSAWADDPTPHMRALWAYYDKFKRTRL